MGNAKQAHK